MQDLKQKLQRLYSDNSKHSNYQNVPGFVREKLGYSEQINEEWRGDSARYKYILKELKFQAGATVGDIGANTGFFTLSLAHSFKRTGFIAYEANRNHADFIWMIKTYFGIDNVSIEKIMVDSDGIGALKFHDILLCLNVLHHAGYDLDRHLGGTVNDFQNYAMEYLEKLRLKTSMLVFQMGSNWGGDKKNPIIDREDDTGKILFISGLFINAGWDIVKIALARRNESGLITYENLPAGIVETIKATGGEVRTAELDASVQSYNLPGFIGEFYRRPVFICQSGYKSECK